MGDTRYINDGPAAQDIFIACLYATTRGWSTPLEFNITGHLVTFTWVNGLTWMGERSEFLAFTVKFEGIEFLIEYNTRMRRGEIASVDPGKPDIVTLHKQYKRKVVDRIRRAL